jgi:hypothetical protein
MLEDDYIEGYSDELDEAEFCRECELYQQEIYRLTCLLRSEFFSQSYENTKERLTDMVQVQLRHQRKHL